MIGPKGSPPRNATPLQHDKEIPVQIKTGYMPDTEAEMPHGTHVKTEAEMKSDKSLTILSLEDSAPDYEIICEHLKAAGYDLNFSRVEKETDYVNALQQTRYDIILADFKLPGFDAFAALRLRNQLCPEVPFICVSGLIGEETATELIKSGADDYVLKDRIGRLPTAVQRALDDAKEISARRQAEDELRESEQNYRTLADSGLTLIWTSGSDSAFNYFNRVWFEFTGRSPEQEMGMGWTEGVHPDDLPHCLQVYSTAFKLKEKFSMEFRLRRSDGEYRWVQNDSCPRYSARNEFIGFIGHCLDITLRKQAENVILGENEELQKLNAEKDKYFSIIAHDLRGPFNAFLGFTRMMEEELSSFTLDELQKIATSMRKSATMLFQLLENLLEWSRLQRGLNSFHMESFRLADEVALGIDLVRDTALEKQISISHHIPEGLTVKADTKMFGSLMRNLVFNAIKFTPKGGSIHIEAKPLPDHEVEIAVSDTGIGMDREMIGQLFSLDDRTHRKGTEGESSTGLGLLLCRDFVEKHGGRIWAESEPGNGSVFHFTLPGLTEPEEGKGIPTSSGEGVDPKASRKLKILIAEDDETSGILLSLAVKKFGKEIRVVSSGTQAVEACRDDLDIDLVMMDIKMPGMDGYEATRQIRQFNKNVFIIAQTAFGQQGDSAKALMAGCDDYITKPINIASLKMRIQRHFMP